MTAMRYVLTTPAGYDAARADRPEILIDAAVARLTVTDLWRDDEEWRVWYEWTPRGGLYPRRKLRYGVSRRYGVYGIDGSGVPTTLSVSLPRYLQARDVDVDSGIDPKHPDYERKVTP